MKLGNRIFELRKKEGISQEQLAEKLNVTRQTISNWELGQTVPDVIQAKEMSKIFNVSLDELVDNDIENILVEKISNTERLGGMTIKILKNIRILIIIIVLISIICISGFFVYETVIANTGADRVEFTYSADSEYCRGETAIKVYQCTIKGHTFFYKIEYYIADYKLNNISWTRYVGEIEEGKELGILNFPELEEKLCEAYNYSHSSDYYDARDLMYFIEDYFNQKGGTYGTRMYTYESTGNKISMIYPD